MVGSSVRDNPFIGRHREMAELTRAMEDAISGQGRIVMLAGEPGIGKTRTADELAARAHQHGAHALWGWCYEEEGAPPYWPWVQPLRSYIHQQDPELLRSQMGPGAADIAEIIPEVREKLPGLEPPPALEPEQARFRLFDSITAFLKNASQPQPLMLVLDDLHWADKSSLLLLQFLVRQLAGSRLLVMGCYRDVELSHQHPLSETLAHLSREPVFQRVLLQGVSEADTARFIKATASIQPSQGLVGAIYSHTEGNPFFMTEVVRLLLERGELSEEAIRGPQGFRIPEGVKEVIGQRLNRLSRHCLQTLTTASVIGREFEFKLLNILNSRVSDEQLLGLIEEALEAHLIEELPGGAERYQFSHALIQETLLSELSAARQARLHARIGEALEDIYGADEESHASELARHFAEAVPVTGSEKLVRYSYLAGEQALAIYAYEEALAHFQRGLAARGIPLNGTEPAPDAQAAELLFGLGRAQAAVFARDRLQEAVTTLGKALSYYIQAGDIERVTDIACTVPPVPGMTQQTDLISEALRAVPPESTQAARLLSRYGLVLGIEQGDYGQAQDAFAHALAIARSHHDESLETKMLLDQADVDFSHLNVKDGLEKSLRVIDLCSRPDEALSKCIAHYTIAKILTITGGVDEMLRHTSALLALAEKLRAHHWLVNAYRSSGAAHVLGGRWDEALEFQAKNIAFSPRDAMPYAIRAWIKHQLGDFEGGRADLQRLLEIAASMPEGPNYGKVILAILPSIFNRITGRSDYPGVASQASESLANSPNSTPHIKMIGRTGLALAALEGGGSKVLAERYSGIIAYRGMALFIGLASCDRVLGLLALKLGMSEQACGHFRDAVTFCKKAGFIPELAWTLHDFANALLLRTDSEGCRLAGEVLDDGVRMAKQLGMRPLMEKLTALKAQLEAQQAKAPGYPSGLTEREVEVLRLLASGSSNAEIAGKLVLSIRTVERHIFNIYSKTNTHGRAEATAFAFTHGLIPSK